MNNLYICIENKSYEILKFGSIVTIENRNAKCIHNHSLIPNVSMFDFIKYDYQSICFFLERIDSILTSNVEFLTTLKIIFNSIDEFDKDSYVISRDFLIGFKLGDIISNIKYSDIGILESVCVNNEIKEISNLYLNTLLSNTIPMCELKSNINYFNSKVIKYSNQFKIINKLLEDVENE